jgi:hypothetical protein
MLPHDDESRERYYLLLAIEVVENFVLERNGESFTNWHSPAHT